jgi:hypothetical protein
MLAPSAEAPILQDLMELVYKARHAVDLDNAIAATLQKATVLNGESTKTAIAEPQGDLLPRRLPPMASPPRRPRRPRALRPVSPASPTSPTGC